MKQQVFYIHGGSAYTNYEAFLETLRSRPLRDIPGMEPLKKWTGTLREDLGPDFEVFMPSMPNSQNAKYLEWKLWFQRYFEHLHDGVILVGWSQGAYFLVKYLLEEDPVPFSVKALVLLAGPFEADNFGGEDGGDFAFDTSRVGDLAEKVPKIVIMHSTDDHIVPYEHATKYKEALPGAKLVTFTDKNHFLVEEFPEIIQEIKASV